MTRTSPSETASLIEWLRAFEGPGGVGVNQAADALEAVTAERDRLSRLHEVATERTVQYAAVVERARNAPDHALRDAVTNEWQPSVYDVLASAPGDVLREHDRATAERAWNELYATQFDGAPFEMSDTTGITDPNNPYRIEGGI